MNTQPEEINSILKFLSHPKPLHSSDIPKKCSAFPLADSPVDDIPPKHQQESITTVKQLKSSLGKEKLHRIGRSLPELFASAIYQSHPQLNKSNNFNFAQLILNLKFKATQQQRQQKKTGSINGQIVFESRFQSGNLAIATRYAEHEYNLCLQRDINTKYGSTQWFYFRVNNQDTTSSVRFNIVNFTKPYSSYTDGMLPVVLSVKSKKGWQRGCYDIEYRKNTIPRNEDQTAFYYTLSFSYDFKLPDDDVYIAYSYPYTYSKLQKYLNRIEKSHSQMFHKRRIATTNLKNNVECVTVTNPQSTKVKPVIFMTARVHPGETPSSYVLQGMINALLTNNKQAEQMRNQMIFKIIPMLNPDGVIHGNYRTSMAGIDLNRCWTNPKKHICPEIQAAKSMIRQCTNNRIAFFDLHGHSKKKGVFVYGCINRSCPYVCKQFPYLMHKLIKDFNYYNCNFLVEQGRQGTARVCMWKQFGITHSYTIESSFLGPEKEKQCYTVKDYVRIGGELIDSIFQYFCRRKVGASNCQQVNQIIEELYNDTKLLKIGEAHSEGSSQGSEDKDLRQISITESPDKQTSNPGRGIMSPVKINLRRTRLSMKKPRVLASQLQTKFTQVSINQTTTEQQPAPLLISLSERISHTVQLHNINRRYTYKPTINFKHFLSIQKPSNQTNNLIVKQSTGRNAYINYRKIRNNNRFTDRPVSQASSNKYNQDRKTNLSMDIGRNRFYI